MRNNSNPSRPSMLRIVTKTSDKIYFVEAKIEHLEAAFTALLVENACSVKEVITASINLLNEYRKLEKLRKLL